MEFRHVRRSFRASGRKRIVDPGDSRHRTRLNIRTTMNIYTRAQFRPLREKQTARLCVWSFLISRTDPPEVRRLSRPFLTSCIAESPRFHPHSLGSCSLRCQWRHQFQSAVRRSSCFPSPHSARGKKADAMLHSPEWFDEDVSPDANLNQARRRYTPSGILAALKCA